MGLLTEPQPLTDSHTGLSKMVTAAVPEYSIPQQLSFIHLASPKAPPKSIDRTLLSLKSLWMCPTVHTCTGWITTLTFIHANMHTLRIYKRVCCRSAGVEALLFSPHALATGGTLSV